MSDGEASSSKAKGNLPYACDLCGYTFKSQNALDLHKPSHERRKFHKEQNCFYCDKSYQDLWNLRRHILNDHKENVTIVPTANTTCYKYKCPECPTVDVLPELRLHYRHKHADGTSDYDLHKCQHCPVEFTCKKERRKHMNEHIDADGNIHYNCLQKGCLQIFQSPTKFAAHYKVHYQNRAYGCRFCPRRFIYVHKCEEHETKYHPERKDKDQKIEKVEQLHRCQYCFVQLFSDNEKIAHRKDHLDKDGNIHFNCLEKKCLRKFESPSDYAAHYMSHYVKRPHSCQFCPQKFNSVGLCANHETKHHTESKEAVEPKDSVALTEKERRYLELRGFVDMLAPGPERNANNVLAFLCPYCGNRLHGADSLALHLTYHEGRNGSFKCNYCLVTFVDIHERDRHQHEHIDEHGNIHFTCIQCGCKLESPSEYATHYKEHYAQRPFGCKFCAKRYNDPGPVVFHEVDAHLDKDTCNEKGSDGLTYKEKRTLELRGYLQYLAPGPIRHFNDMLGLICPECEKIVYGAQNLKAHLQHHEGKLQCELCDFHAYEPARLKLHMTSHAEEKSFTCEICGNGFKRENDLKSHHKRCHSKKQLSKCSICENDFPDTYTLKVHIIKDHGGSDKCNFCEMRFTIRTIREQHEQDAHPEMLPIVCDTCGERFRQKKCLVKHSMLHEPIPKTCLDCHAEFPDGYGLTQHFKKEHEGYKPYECPTCGKRFIKESEIRVHMRYSHKVARDEQVNTTKELTPKEEKELEATGYIEYLCKELERDKYNHLALICPKCDRKVYGIFRLKQHLATHKGVECEYCSYTDDTPDRLKAHIISKHREKVPLKCGICNDRFKNKMSLSRHAQIHKAKSCTCLDCHQKFKDKYTLLQHVKSEHKHYLPYACHLCGKRFALPQSLVQHKKQIHKVKSKSKSGDQNESDDDDESDGEIEAIDELIQMISKLLGLSFSENSNIERKAGAHDLTTVLKKLEADIVHLASSKPARYFICVFQGSQSQTVSNRILGKMNETSVTLIEESLEFYVFYFGNLELNISYNSLKDLETALKQNETQQDIVHFVREYDTTLRKHLDQIATTKIVVTNCLVQASKKKDI